MPTDTTDWLAYCLAKPGAWRDEPWDGQVVVKVAGGAGRPSSLAVPDRLAAAGKVMV